MLEQCAFGPSQLRGLVASVLVGLGLVTTSAQSVETTGKSFTTRFPIGLPISVGLPSDFVNEPLSSGMRFVASAPDATVTVESEAFTAKSFALLESAAKVDSRQTLLALDPKASLMFQTINLEVGEVEQTVSHLTETTGGKKVPISLISFVFAHNGRSYNFTYYCSASQWSHYLPIFKQSAGSIRFS